MTRLVLLEDKVDVREALALEFARRGVEVVSPHIFDAKGSFDPQAIEAAFSERPDVVLVDLVWVSDEGDEPDSLDEIERAVRNVDWKDVPIYLMSGYRHTGEEHRKQLGDWRTKLASRLIVVDIVSKPISTEKLMALLPANGKMPSLNADVDIERLGLPARLLDRNRTVVSSNSAWSWGANDPDTGKKGKTQRDSQFVVPTLQPPGTIAAGRHPRLAQYRLEEVEVDKERSLQLAFPIDDRRRTTGRAAKEELLRDVFASLSRIGFRRMRYYERYRVPCSQRGYLSEVALLHLFPRARAAYPTLPDAAWRNTSPIVAPRDEPLIDRFAAFDTDMTFQKLVSQLSHHEERQPARSYFNEITGTDNSHVRVRVPILRPIENFPTRYYAHALLVLDRQGDEIKADVDETDMKWAEVTLLGACEELRRLLADERSEHERMTVKAIHGAYRDLLSQSSMSQPSLEAAPEQFAQAFIDQACELTGAHDGVLFWTIHPDRQPRLLAFKTNRPRMRQPVQMSIGDELSPELHPLAWQTWTARTDTFAPEFVTGDGKPQSRIGLPLRVGDKVFGCLALMHAKPRHFRVRKANALRQLVELFSYPLQFAVERHDRRTWEGGLSHELKTNLVGAMQHLHAFKQNNEDRWYMGAMNLLNRSLDTTSAFLALESPIRSYSAEDVFAPDVVLEEEIAYFDQMASAKNTALEIMLSAPDTRLETIESIFRSIIRIVVHNAIEHGDADDRIQISSTLQSDKWVLRISNSGRMTAEADQHKWDRFYRNPKSSRLSGVHLGLATARHWSMNLGAHIDVENSPDLTRVEALLEWPLKSHPEREDKSR